MVDQLLNRANLAFLFVVCIFSLTGCETVQPPTKKPIGRGSQVSSIPWNRPAKWEGPAAMGGMASMAAAQ
jgi:hypothetical protein